MFPADLWTGTKHRD